MRWLILVVMLGCYLIWQGLLEFRLNARSQREPQQLSLADLEAHGAGSNVHVELSDFWVCWGDYVYKQSGSRYDKLWVPAAPLEGEFEAELLRCWDESGNRIEGTEIPTPRRVRTVFVLSDVRDVDAEIDRLAAGETVRGMVVNDIDRIESDEQRLLEKSYPQMSSATCILFQVDRRPSGPGGVALFWLSGLACIGFTMWYVKKHPTADAPDDDAPPRRTRKRLGKRARRVSARGRGRLPPDHEEPEPAPI